MSHANLPLPDHCPNCATRVHGRYCAACGQETQIQPPTLHEFLHHYVALEGKLLRTLKLLLFKPGQLTVEYLAGRRQQLVRPLPLYATFSFLFFLFLGWSMQAQGDHFGNIRVNSRPVVTQGPALAGANAADPGQLINVDEVVLKRLPYTILAMTPVFAALCRLLYRRRGLRYGHHLLFALHLHAFIFVLYLLTLLPPVHDYGSLAYPIIWLYLILALKRVYGGRWWPQLLRGSALALIYGLLTALVLTGLTLWALGPHAGALIELIRQQIARG